jgi:hypothetical protein
MLSESRRTPGVDNADLMPPWAERPLLSVSSPLLPPLSDEEEQSSSLIDSKMGRSSRIWGVQVNQKVSK